MVGQGSYNNSIIETDDQSVKYSFDVYNPWSNEITASLTHDKTDCDDYMIKGDRLWLINSDAGRATIYDKDLKEIKPANIILRTMMAIAIHQILMMAMCRIPAIIMMSHRLPPPLTENMLSCQVSHPIPTNMQSLI